MNSPAFQFYAADYLADVNVQLMTLEEEGCYIRLLSFCWREGSIPSDEALLSRLSKGASTTVVRVVAKCFNQHPEDASRLIHPRLEQEREKQRIWREKSVEGGRKSAEKRQQKQSKSKGGSTNPATVVQPNPLNTISSSSSSSSSSKERINTFAVKVPNAGENPMDDAIEFLEEKAKLWFRMRSGTQIVNGDARAIRASAKRNVPRAELEILDWWFGLPEGDCLKKYGTGRRQAIGSLFNNLEAEIEKAKRAKSKGSGGYSDPYGSGPPRDDLPYHPECDEDIFALPHNE